MKGNQELKATLGCRASLRAGWSYVRPCLQTTTVSLCAYVCACMFLGVQVHMYLHVGMRTRDQPQMSLLGHHLPSLGPSMAWNSPSSSTGCLHFPSTRVIRASHHIWLYRTLFVFSSVTLSALFTSYLCCACSFHQYLFLCLCVNPSHGRDRTLSFTPNAYM